MADDTDAQRAKDKPERDRAKNKLEPQRDRAKVEPQRDRETDKPPRRFRGFRQAGVLIAAQTRAAATRRGYLDARIKALWSDIAGPEIAAIARPVKLTPARGPAGGLLTLGVLGANGPRVQMLLPIVRERVNAALGPGVVGRIQIAQAGLAEAPAPFAHERRAEPPPDIARFAEPLSSIGDADLRAALETLAQNVISRTRKRNAPGPQAANES